MLMNGHCTKENRTKESYARNLTQTMCLLLGLLYGVRCLFAITEPKGNRSKLINFTLTPISVLLIIQTREQKHINLTTGFL